MGLKNIHKSISFGWCCSTLVTGQKHLQLLKQLHTIGPKLSNINRNIWTCVYFLIPEINPRKYFSTRHILGKMTLKEHISKSISGQARSLTCDVIPRPPYDKSSNFGRTYSVHCATISWKPFLSRILVSVEFMSGQSLDLPIISQCGNTESAYFPSNASPIPLKYQETWDLTC